jgi:hypothetical protein
MIALTVPLLLLLLSLPLLFLGWRGRVVGSQPVCRRCGFDLTGLPVTSTACPECGSDLRKPHTTRTGHLLRRWGMLWTGAVLLASGTTRSPEVWDGQILFKGVKVEGGNPR